jgi:NAD-reducing hydrogenase small subunit
MAKPKIATDWMGACSGCHMSLLDMDERLVELLGKVELTSSPITDLKVPPESGVDVGVLEGAVNNTDNEHVAKRMRERCKILVAIGDCAVFGGILGMRNFEPAYVALERAYEGADTTVDGKVPDSPEIMRPVVNRAVNEVVKVDVHVPGCPPRADVLYYVLSELAEGRIPKLDETKLTYD